MERVFRMLLKSRDPRKWSTNNRPTPRAVQVLVIVAITVPAVVVGAVAFIVADVLTVNWPKGEAK